MVTVAVERKCVIGTVKFLRTSLLKALDESPDGIILDVSQTDEIDTAGIQLFVSLVKEIEKRGVSLELKGPMNDRVLKQFEISGVRYGEQFHG
ncbi:STAS domain-containing protein [Marispirochaeta sp.]|uniref:STAS domain-containing protein n=1 Tax=Marispirochaeta sp. TaxID=2038653 RepID=UPI0029C935BF|nr:STAS domain-containing protein [Marispirochaeta sp.]